MCILMSFFLIATHKSLVNNLHKAFVVPGKRNSRLQLRLKSAVGDQRVMRVWQPGQSTIFCMGVTGKAVRHLGHTTVLGRGICWTGGCIGS